MKPKLLVATLFGCLSVVAILAMSHHNDSFGARSILADGEESDEDSDLGPFWTGPGQYDGIYFGTESEFNAWNRGNRGQHGGGLYGPKEGSRRERGGG